MTTNVIELWHNRELRKIEEAYKDSEQIPQYDSDHSANQLLDRQLTSRYFDGFKAKVQQIHWFWLSGLVGCYKLDKVSDIITSFKGPLMVPVLTLNTGFSF